MTAEQRAAELVTVGRRNGAWTIAIGEHEAGFVIGANRLAIQDWIEKAQAAITAALTAHGEEMARQAVQEALAEGMRGCPVSEERMEEIENYWEKWDQRGRLDQMKKDRDDLMAVVNWQKVLIAALLNDNDDAARMYRLGLEAGETKKTSLENAIPLS